MTDASKATSSDTKRVLAIALAIYAVALLLRAAVLFEVKDHPTIAAVPVLDMHGNHEFALAILEGLPPTTYYKAPFYTYFMAGIYAILGPDPLNVRIVQIVLVSFVPVLTFLIGRRFFGTAVGAVGGVFAAVFWTFLYFSIELLDTELACLFYLLLAYLLLVLDDRRWWKWLVCGVILGLGAITRPNILAFGPVLAFTVVIVGWKRQAREASRDSGRRRRRVLLPVGHAAALTIGCVCAIAPVTLRNRLVGGEWVLLGAYGGMNLYVANSPYSDSKDGPLLLEDTDFVEPTTWDPNEVWANCCLNYYLSYRVAETELGRPPKPGEFSAVMADKALAFLRENPRWLAKHAFRRLCWLFNTYEFHSNRDFYHFRKWSRVLTAASALQFGVICPLAVLGIVLALGRCEYRTAGMAYYVGMIASLAFPAVLFIINARFRLPMVHLFMPFAAYGLVRVIDLSRPIVSWRRRAAVLGGLLALALFSNANLFDYWTSLKAHLRWAMVMACEKTGRDDLLPEAVREFEAQLAEDLTRLRPSNTTETLKHGRPMTWLFTYYLEQGNEDKALHYGRRMLARDPFHPRATMESFGFFLRHNLPEDAAKAIEKMNGKVPPHVLGDCLLLFGRLHHDRASLRRAVDLFEIAAERTNQPERFRARIEKARRLLKGLQPTTTRQSSTTTSFSP